MENSNRSSRFWFIEGRNRKEGLRIKARERLSQDGIRITISKADQPSTKGIEPSLRKNLELFKREYVSVDLIDLAKQFGHVNKKEID